MPFTGGRAEACQGPIARPLVRTPRGGPCRARLVRPAHMEIKYRGGRGLCASVCNEISDASWNIEVIRLIPDAALGKGVAIKAGSFAYKLGSYPLRTKSGITAKMLVSFDARRSRTARGSISVRRRPRESPHSSRARQQRPAENTTAEKSAPAGNVKF